MCEKSKILAYIRRNYKALGKIHSIKKYKFVSFNGKNNALLTIEYYVKRGGTLSLYTTTDPSEGYYKYLSIEREKRLKKLLDK